MRHRTKLRSDRSNKSKVRMISPQKGRDVIDMSATLDKHIDIVPYLLLTHAITGCDTVAAYSGVSKNVETSRFILACYGQSCETTMPLSRKKSGNRKLEDLKLQHPNWRLFHQQTRHLK